MFACPDPGGGAERLVVMAETRATDEEATAARCAPRSSRTTVDLLGVAPDDVVLAPPRTVPKTSSGKIRRAASRQIYEQGRIGARPRALWWQLARLRAARSGAVVAPRPPRGGRGRVRCLHVAAARGPRGAGARPAGAAAPGAVAPADGLSGAVRLLARLTATAVSVHGLDRLPDGSSIVVANHPSWLDGVVLATVLPPSFRFAPARCSRIRC